MTAKKVRACGRHISAFSRRVARPSFTEVALESERAQGMPGDGLTRGPRAVKNARGRNPRFSRIIRHSLRDGLRFIRDLPGDRAFLPPSPRIILQGLTSASGGQD